MTALVNLAVVLVAIGLVWWLLTLLPLPQPIRTVLNVVLILVVIVLVLSTLGLIGPLKGFG